MDAGTIIAIVTGVVTSLGALFMGRRQGQANARKSEAEADSIVVDSADKAIKIWEDLNKQLRQDLTTIHLEYERVLKENKEIKREFERVISENSELKQKMADMQSELDQLKRRMK